MLGGEWFEALFGSPDEVSEETITQVALEELETQLSLTARPTNVFCKIQKVRLDGYLMYLWLWPPT